MGRGRSGQGDRLDPARPYHEQILGRLLEAIQGGELPVGARLPSERELAERFGVSRMTGRRALQELVELGLAERQVGRGSFVVQVKVRQQLQGLTSFTEDMRALGMRPSSRVLDVARRLPDAEAQRLLGLRRGEPVLYLKRLRLADGRPMALEINHLPLVRLPGLESLPREALEGSLYELFGSRWDRRPASATQTLEADLAGPEEARLLEVRPGAPILRITRLSRDQDGIPLEFVRSYYPGDRYRFQAELRRPAGEGGSGRGDGGRGG
ncbi:MAG: GntR family transcriptional regulator [Bacillota bacterium]|nr:GntR family transcriptional regulator [Bacillota bacterium]